MDNEELKKGTPQQIASRIELQELLRNLYQEAFEKAKESQDKPTVIVANTIKGKGVSFMENQAGWHGKAPNDEQLAQALEELK